MYPRVLVVVLGRINRADNANNGLLLRNLFADWPRENLAQIYSSGDNGDAGYFGHNYLLRPQDRRMGSLFYRLKAKALSDEDSIKSTPPDPVTIPPRIGYSFKSISKRLLVDSGLYEILFRPRLSAGMLSWAEDFRPDIIFAQGYCLTFAWLPVLLSKQFLVPIAYYPTDDWPSETYRSDVKASVLESLMNKAVSHAARDLVECSSVRFAFNRYMQAEYIERYRRDFSVIMHGDNKSRYCGVHPFRLAKADECWIVATGLFDESRKLLLDDLEQACIELDSRGIRARATVFPVNSLAEFTREIEKYRHIDFAPCPAHDELAAVLRGADILFLPERFSKSAEGIRMSVSSKAHLFMFSEKPIVVYSAPITGIARYAKEDGWAAVVDRRDTRLLADTFARIIADNTYRQTLIERARLTVGKNHDLNSIRAVFREKIYTAITNKGIGNSK
jgi:glycosyltransferase involved in cell wall biosynthesis